LRFWGFAGLLVHLALRGPDDSQIPKRLSMGTLHALIPYSPLQPQHIDTLQSVVPSETQIAAGVQLISCDMYSCMNEYMYRTIVHSRPTQV
jgi:hypothetical protein